MQRCRDDMLSSDENLNAVAKKRIAELDRAFEYLTEPKKFRDFHELVNDKLKAGNVEPGTLVARVAHRESSAGARLEPAEPVAPIGSLFDPSDQAIHMSLAEEREVLKELRRKRLETAPKIGQKRRQAMDKLIKETLASIEQTANSTARSKASELVARGVTDPDEFYERVYTAALELATIVRNQAVRQIEEQSLPIDEKTVDEWDQAVLDKSETAAEREYNNLEGVIAAEKPRAPSGPRFMFKLAITLCSIAAALCFFCNFSGMITANRPDALRQQISSAGGSDTTNSDIASIYAHLPSTVAANPAVANAEGMAPGAGQAGTAGSAQSLALDGAADYNAGLSSMLAARYADSIESFSRAISRSKNTYQFFYNRGLSRLALGNYNYAIQDFDSAITLRTDLMQARYNKGCIYLAGGEDCIGRAAGAEGEVKDWLMRQAAVNLRAAIAEFSVVESNMPRLAQPLYNRGLARYRMGDVEGAVSDFQAAAAKDNQIDAAAYNLKIARAALAGENWKETVSGTVPGAPVGPQGPPGPGVF